MNKASANVWKIDSGCQQLAYDLDTFTPSLRHFDTIPVSMYDLIISGSPCGLTGR